MGCREPTSAVAVGVRDRAATTKVVPNWVRVTHPLGVGVIPVGGEVLNRLFNRHRRVPRFAEILKIRCLLRYADWQVAWSANLTGRPRDRIGVGEIETRVALDELLDGDAQFKTGQV